MLYRTLVFSSALLLASCETTTTNPETGEVTVTRPSSELAQLISIACNLFLDQNAILGIIGANLGESNEEQANAVCDIFRNQQAETIQTAARSTEVTIELPNGTEIVGVYNPSLPAQ